MDPSAYLDINRTSWNARVDLHMQSPFYDLDAFLQGKCSLQPIEVALLGALGGIKLLHLQCHFGQDSISLARRGAIVTGVDLSDKAIDAANVLAKKTGQDATFICCDVCKLPSSLHASFDIAFTSYGVLGWLPNLSIWAHSVAKVLRPGGRLVLVEFHPFLWMYDNAFKSIFYDYFNTGPIRETETGTYAAPDANIILETMTWNHPLSDAIGSLLEAGFQLCHFAEYDYSPYPCFSFVEASEPGKYRIRGLDRRVPMLYSLTARKT